MGLPSEPASNGIIYTTYSLFLIFGLAVGWRFRNSKGDYLSALRTQTSIPLALNFVASSIGAGILFTYPQIGTFAGIQGVIIYAFASAFPILTFPFLASKIRKLCPHGFVLTEFVRERFGIIASLYLSVFSVLTIFIFMCSELTSVSYAVESLTGMSGLAATIVQVIITMIYSAVGGFRTSLITDNVQGTMIFVLLIICSAAIGTQVTIDQTIVEATNLTGSTKLGWQLLYILPVAVLFNAYFLSGLWQRAFASKTDKDLWIGCSIATVFIFIILVLVGFTGIIAVWSGSVDPADTVAASSAFFYLLALLPAWVVGFCIVFALCMSCAAYDTFQTAIVATISNDVFRNKLNLWWVRLILLVNVPAIVVATLNLDILVLYLISDLVSAAVLPPILLGLVPALYFLNGFDIIVGGLGGFFTVFLFGLVYYNGDAAAAGGVLILESGLYASDWSAFGAFVAAPVGGLLWMTGAFLLRWLVAIVRTRFFGAPYTIFDRKAIKTEHFTDGPIDPRETVSPKEDSERNSQK